jgi:hypothetical protein
MYCDHHLATQWNERDGGSLDELGRGSTCSARRMVRGMGERQEERRDDVASTNTITPLMVGV